MKYPTDIVRSIINQLKWAETVFVETKLKQPSCVPAIEVPRKADEDASERQIQYNLLNFTDSFLEADSFNILFFSFLSEPLLLFVIQFSIKNNNPPS